MRMRFSALSMVFALVLVTASAFAEVSWIDKNQSGLIGSPTKPVRKLYIGSLTPIVLEGAVTNDYQTTFTVTEPTADRTITFPDSSGTVQLAGDVDSANGVWFSTDAIVYEGATANAFEFSLKNLTDPTADITVKVPSLTAGNLMLSTLATNDVDVASSVWGASNAVVYEGATANAFETSVSATDPTVGDQVWQMPDLAAATTVYFMPSTLATNAPDIANSVTGASNALVYEGTADAFETSIKAGDPTVGDQIWQTPDLAAALTVYFMPTTLSSNAPDVANSVWGVSNGLTFEGATANAFETNITVTDPTADRTITVPNADGTVALLSGAGSNKTFTIATDNVVLTAADSGKVYAIGTDAKVFTLPPTAAGMVFTFINSGGAGNNIVEVNPDDNDQIYGTITLAASVVVINGDAGEALLNTKATSRRGDSVTLIGDGVDGWYVVASTGIWAEATP